MARFYVTACASCHYNGSTGINPSLPDLALNSGVHLSDPTNLIRVILFGIDAPEGAPGLVMPAFGSGFGDGPTSRGSPTIFAAPAPINCHGPTLATAVAAIRAQGKGA